MSQKKKMSTKSCEGREGSWIWAEFGEGYNQDVMYEMYKELTKILLKVLIRGKWRKILYNSQQSKWKQKSSYYKWNNPNTERKMSYLQSYAEFNPNLRLHQAPMDGAKAMTTHSLGSIEEVIILNKSTWMLQRNLLGRRGWNNCKS